MKKYITFFIATLLFTNIVESNPGSRELHANSPGPLSLSDLHISKDYEEEITEHKSVYGSIYVQPGIHNLSVGLNKYEIPFRKKIYNELDLAEAYLESGMELESSRNILIPYITLVFEHNGRVFNKGTYIEDQNGNRVYFLSGKGKMDSGGCTEIDFPNSRIDKKKYRALNAESIAPDYAKWLVDRESGLDYFNGYSKERKEDLLCTVGYIQLFSCNNHKVQVCSNCIDKYSKIFFSKSGKQLSDVNTERCCKNKKSLCAKCIPLVIKKIKKINKKSDRGYQGYSDFVKLLESGQETGCEHCNPDLCDLCINELQELLKEMYDDDDDVRLLRYELGLDGLDVHYLHLRNKFLLPSNKFDRGHNETDLRCAVYECRETLNDKITHTEKQLVKYMVSNKHFKDFLSNKIRELKEKLKEKHSLKSLPVLRSFIVDGISKIDICNDCHTGCQKFLHENNIWPEVLTEVAKQEMLDDMPGIFRFIYTECQGAKKETNDNAYSSKLGSKRVEGASAFNDLNLLSKNRITLISRTPERRNRETVSALQQIRKRRSADSEQMNDLKKFAVEGFMSCSDENLGSMHLHANLLQLNDGYAELTNLLQQSPEKISEVLNILKSSKDNSVKSDIDAIQIGQKVEEEIYSLSDTEYRETGEYSDEEDSIDPFIIYDSSSENSSTDDLEYQDRSGYRDPFDYDAKHDTEDGYCSEWSCASCTQRRWEGYDTPDGYGEDSDNESTSCNSEYESA